MTWKYGSAGSYFPVVGRVFIGFLFLAGAFKFMDMAGIAVYIGSVGLPMPTLLAWVSTVAEVGGALMLITGFHARTAALGLVVYTALATVFFHNNLADQMQFTMALKNIAIIGGLLYIAKFGSGMMSVKVNKDCGCCDDGSCVCGADQKKAI
ncbi:MAG: putative oxidoreductase [Parcubacteria group bacterium Gr01-1014_8]|nr:MAG: putative oxidoreductase [Parcubacteria group bacterium Gr01-1014_8]